jgi:hypothetical protein
MSATVSATTTTELRHRDTGGAAKVPYPNWLGHQKLHRLSEYSAGRRVAPQRSVVGHGTIGE